MTPAASAKNLEELAKYRVLAFQKGLTTTVCREGGKRKALEKRKGEKNGERTGREERRVDVLTTFVALAS